MNPPTPQQIACKLLTLGFSVIPVNADKSAAISWKKYQSLLMSTEDASQLFSNGHQLAIVSGKVSGNLECIDVDDPTLFDPFLSALEDRSPGLPGKLCQRKTPNGYHVLYRCQDPVAGNQKLAMSTDNKVSIETRGEGGYFLHSPSDGYEVIINSLKDCPVLSADEVRAIHLMARMFDERSTPEEPPRKKQDGDSVRPGDAFNQKHNAGDLLKEHGWKPAGRTTAGMGYTRPGKKTGVSGVLLDTGNFYVWSSNADQLQAGDSYSPFALYTMFDHGGDFTAAARAIAGKEHSNSSAADDFAAEPTTEGGYKCSELEPKISKIYTLSDYLKADFPPPTPLIGSTRNAFLVRGEGMFVAGRSGTGKTMLSADMAVKMATGYDVFKYSVPEPLRVLIYQAELPNPFFQQRLMHLTEAYSLGNKELTAASMDRIFIADVKKPFNIAEKDNTAVEVVGEEADKCKADVVVIDPFLSFYVGDENVNPEVRRGLDLLKIGVAKKLSLGIMITDHQPKYSNVTQGQEHAMRGAGAKHDWAAAVMAISSAKTPAGEHGDFIKVHIDKLRYGPKPREPFIIRRDTHTGLHNLWEGETIEPVLVAKVLDDIGGGVSRTIIREAVMAEFEVSRRIADKIVYDAVEAGFIDTKGGPRKAVIHNLGKKYFADKEEV